MNREENRTALRLQNLKELPIAQDKRTCTDVFCLIIGLLFSLTIVTIASVLFNKTTFYSVNFPTDSDGKLCGQDLPDHQYLYFSNAPLINVRVCVSKCPSKGDLTLSCQPNSLVKSCNFSPLNKYLQTAADETRYGFFCWPVDPITTRIIKQAAHLLPRIQFFQSLDSVKASLIFALGFSAMLALLTHFFPIAINYIIIPVSGLVIFATSLLIFNFSTSQTGLRASLGCVFLLIVCLIVVSVYKNSVSIKIHAILLKQSSILLSNKFSLFFYVIFYLVLLVLLIGLVMFQLVGFWCAGRKIFIPAEFIYYELQGITVSSLVTLALTVQLVWGVTYLKQSFNFCLSYVSAIWYIEEPRQQTTIFQPLKLQILKHTGSIIACSFMTAFFSFFDFLFDIVKPLDQMSTYGKCFSFLFGCCVSLWDLVRSDTMTMVAMAGNPFCNSARYCQYLCEKSPVTAYSQSCNRIFSLSSHFLITGSTVIFSVYFTKNTSIFALLMIIGGALTFSTFFVSLHADIAEAIQIVYLLDHEFRDRMEGKLLNKHQIEGLSLSSYHKDFGKQVQAAFKQETKENQKR